MRMRQFQLTGIKDKLLLSKRLRNIEVSILIIRCSLMFNARMISTGVDKGRRRNHGSADRQSRLQTSRVLHSYDE